MSTDEGPRAGGQTDDLQMLERIALEMGAAALAEEAQALRERIAAGQFYVACVGQFKRGKSTLINALVGEAVLPTGVNPVTAVPTVLRDGPRGARVRLQDGGWRAIPLTAIADYVTEERNSENAKGALAAELFLPAPLLLTGICLVDTPGIGSVFQANSASARAFVPQIDAAVVVLGADPPISGEELALVGEVAESVEDLVFVLNKMDRLPPHERQEAVAFTKRILRERLGSPVDHVFEVSALAAVRDEGDAGAWTDLVRALERLPARRGQLVAGALRRGVGRLGLRLERTLGQQRAALVRPVEDSERMLGELRDIAAGAERSLGELGPLLGGEQLRLRRRFEERRARFLERVAPAATTELRQRLEILPPDRRLQRAVALEAANAVARECIGPWLADAERDAEAAYREATRRFAEYGALALARLGEVAGLDAAALHLEAEPADGLRARRGFYFHDLLYRHDPPRPWRPFIDRLLPIRVSRRRVADAADRYLADLLTVNASRVEGDLNERVQESRRSLEAQVAALLAEVGQAAEQAVERARQTRNSGQEAVRAAVFAIEQHLAEVARITGARGRAA